MITLLIALLYTFAVQAAWADFSETTILPHPVHPQGEPFILEIMGVWPTDCHPGEQNPVIRDYTGDSVRIEFDMSVVHITCNDTPTPFRSLVDMSDVIGTVDGTFSSLDVEVRFDGATIERTVELDCDPGAPCPLSPAPFVGPRSGLYYGLGLESQGLLLARQNEWMAAYPLTYDLEGDSAWLVGGGRIVEDVYFASLYRLKGGQCLGCPQPEVPPEAEPVGKVTLFMDSDSRLQMKVNDGPFAAYRGAVFGYTTVNLGPDGDTKLADLAGRWGLSENHGTEPPLGDLTAFLPGAFDIQPDVRGLAGSETPPGGEKHYVVKNLTGEVLGDLACLGDNDSAGEIAVCEYTEPGDGEGPLFLFYQEGPSSLRIVYARLVIGIGTAPGGKAIRLD